MNGMDRMRARVRQRSEPARRVMPRSRVAASIALLIAGSTLASCERTPTKADYVDDRVAAECAGRTGEAFTLCRLEVIKKYMHVPLDQMQAQFPAPEIQDRLGCS